MQPIITSLLDTDFYKFTMAQIAWLKHRDVVVKYAFKNRTSSVRIADEVSETRLRDQLDQLRALRFTEDELAYLRQVLPVAASSTDGGFPRFLQDLRLPEYRLARKDGQYVIEVTGKWPEAILWETLILSVVNELYYEARLNSEGPQNAALLAHEAMVIGTGRVPWKIATLRRHPGIRFADFGTRRRFSREWHRYVVTELARELPEQFLGTSNVLLAKDLGLKPIGTFAHEMFMVYAALAGDNDDDLRGSHNRVLQDWWQEYGEPLSIALTDTFGTEFFFRDFAPWQGRLWRGLRQDSGDPFLFGEVAIAFYAGGGARSPRQKVVVFILETPISPELLPPDAEGKIAQKTEEKIGPYELHDFFGYAVVRFGFRPSKIARLALHAFGSKYPIGEIKRWLATFHERFFGNQYKRSCLPDGPKVGLTSISPRGDWRMPSDAKADCWLADLATVPDQLETTS